MIASTPAKGPSPTTLIQISAQISMSTLRMVSSERRDRKCSDALGDDVRAARKADAAAPAPPPARVPRKAMAIVSTSASR